jgi:REP element-mobilizing transposase RayT
MVIGYHVIFSTYGFWLPNDPRGSWSEFIGKWELLRFGPATKTNVRRSVAAVQHDSGRRIAAKAALRYAPVMLTGLQVRAVGRGFARYIEKSGLTVWACSIMPQHVHMVVGRHSFDVEYAVNQLKGHATRQLRTENVHPPSACWVRGHWRVFLNMPQDIERAIQYVERNPEKDGLPPQRWPFVQLFSRDPQGSTSR